MIVLSDPILEKFSKFTMKSPEPSKSLGQNSTDNLVPWMIRDVASVSSWGTRHRVICSAARYNMSKSLQTLYMGLRGIAAGGSFNSACCSIVFEEVSYRIASTS